VIRKTLLLILLAAIAAVVTKFFTQDSAATAQSPASPGIKAEPTLEKALPPSGSSPVPGAKSEKALPATKDAAKSPTADRPTLPPPVGSLPPASSQRSDKSAPPGRSPTPASTQSAPSPLPSSSSRTLVVDPAFVTLNDDNKVPATEGGMIIGLLVKEGDSVEKETLVAQIDNRATLAKQEIAKAEWNAAIAQASNNAEVQVAKEAVEVSKADLESLDEIRSKNRNAIPDAEYRKSWFQMKRSEAQVTQATNEKEIAGLTAGAKKAQYDAASIELDLRQIKAPFKGQVVEILKKTGDWVTVGEPIMHIVGLDRLKVIGYVPASGEAGARQGEVIGKPVSITVQRPGGQTHTVNGFIGFASPVIEGTGSRRHYRVWAEVDNEKATDPVTGQEVWRIQPGSMATMTIDLTPRPTYPAAKTDGKGKVQSFKPVTGDAERKGKER
jgi:multidrug efflux pump subunit AcrA (membrane-fusion protein)